MRSMIISIRLSCLSSYRHCCIEHRKVPKLNLRAKMDWLTKEQASPAQSYGSQLMSWCQERGCRLPHIYQIDIKVVRMRFPRKSLSQVEQKAHRLTLLCANNVKRKALKQTITLCNNQLLYNLSETLT